MIELKPAKHPQLAGGNPFGFRTQRKTKTRRLFRGVPQEHEGQGVIVGYIERELEKLVLWPCEYTVTIGAQEGEQILDGDVKAYDVRSFREAEAVLTQVQSALTAFTLWYSQASFNIEATQTITITRIHPIN